MKIKKYSGFPDEVRKFYLYDLLKRPHPREIERSSSEEVHGPTDRRRGLIYKKN